MASLRDLLGDECSAVATYPMGAGTVAYAIYRGIQLAAHGATATAAEAALRQKVERHLPALRDLEELTAFEEVNLVLEQPEALTRRVPTRPMTPARSLLELDLGVAGALVFRDPDTKTYTVRSRAADGTPQLIRLGEPVLGDDPVVRPFPVPGRTPLPTEEDELRLTKAPRVRALLRCPRCRGELEDREGGLRCAPCARDYPHCLGKPLLCAEPGYDGEPRGKLESQNPYGQQALDLIERHRDGWVLDMGCGNPRRGFYNVVHLDLSAYDGVDVVTDGGALPFADGTFDAVLSEAVLEHVRDPDEYMAELVRVLKPGGRVRVDVAFLQPFHAYPHHYFNMTRAGLELTIERAGLQLLELGVSEPQEPWVALGMLTAGIVHSTNDPERRREMLQMTIGEMLQRLERHDARVFQALAPEAIDRYAAGFSCLAEKPR